MLSLLFDALPRLVPQGLSMKEINGQSHVDAVLQKHQGKSREQKKREEKRVPGTPFTVRKKLPRFEYENNEEIHTNWY